MVVCHVQEVGRERLIIVRVVPGRVSRSKMNFGKDEFGV